MIRRLNPHSFYLSVVTTPLPPLAYFASWYVHVRESVSEAIETRKIQTSFLPTHAVLENEAPSLPAAVSSDGGNGAGGRERRRRRDFDFARRGQGDGQEDLACAQAEIGSVLGS
jgi:hypothetical protein